MIDIKNEKVEVAQLALGMYVAELDRLAWFARIWP